MLFKKSPAVAVAPAPAPEPTLESKLASANTAATRALHTFESAAKGLELAADALDAVRDQAAAEAIRHRTLEEQAADAANVNRVQATKIRELIGA